MVFLALATLLAGCDGTLIGADWTGSAHPCVGNRTDALWLDDAEVAWVGCGSTTEGHGAYTTSDGGGSWEPVQTDPNGCLEPFRVTDISRSADGLLYFAGTRPSGGQRVVSVDADGTLAEVFVDQDGVPSGFQVGTFRRASDGFAVAESLTGADLVYRTGDQAEWQDGAGWSTAGGSHQLLDLEVYDGDFYGCGSTIAEPPLVFLPPTEVAGGFSLDPVQLATGLAEYSGELWGIDVDADGVVVGGTNQDRNVGMVYVSGDDPHDSGDWAAFDVSTLYPDDPSWIRGVCRGAGRMVAVGELSMAGSGLVLLSEDQGSTWEDLSPEGAPPLFQCQVLDDGSFGVAGANGFFGVSGG